MTLQRVAEKVKFSDMEIDHSAPSTSRAALAEDPVTIREMFLADPEKLALLKQNNPEMAEALLSGNLERFKAVFDRQIEDRAKVQEEFIKMVNSDPFDPKSQRLIEEEIRDKNIEANLEAAMEYMPETFGKVTMLFINCKVNGTPVKAFIDSGAQTTIMSVSTATKCGITRLIDRRWTGFAQGVGVQKIVGRIHLAQIQIEDTFLASSFTILEVDSVDMLLGLDLLKQHQCCINLKENHLFIGTTGIKTKFLSESDLPLYAKLTNNTEDQNMEMFEKVVAGNKIDIQPFTASRNRRVLATDNFNETDVIEIVDLGFNREQVIEKLRKFNGDKTYALDSLFSS